MYIEGNYIDVVKGEIYPAKITFSKTIQKIEKTKKTYDTYISPGFIDSHIRFEDSFINPIEFTRYALLSGVTCVVEDLSGFFSSVGTEGIKYLTNTFSKLPISFHYLFPINLEHSKHEGSPKELKQDEFLSLLKQKQFLGVTQIDDAKKLTLTDSVIVKRIAAAKLAEKPIISNIPKINFSEIGHFTQLGVRADLGSTIYQEAFEKACFGLKIKIVEGTKRKTLASLIRLSKQFDTTIVSEEKSTQEIMKGYFKATLKKAVSLGLDPVTAVKNVTINPAKLLGLSEGSLEEGMPANIVELQDIKSFEVKRVIVQGETVVKAGKLATLKTESASEPRYKIDLPDLDAEMLEIASLAKKEAAQVVTIDPESLQTSLQEHSLETKDGAIQSSVDEDVLKCVVANIYGKETISLSYVKGFGLEKGAFGTTIYGSSGNIIVIGTNDEDIAQTINILKKAKGGFATVDKKREQIFELQILGVVSSDSAEAVHENMKKVNQFVKRLGCKIPEPFFALGSLMDLNKNGYRITDKGVFNTGTEELIQVLKE